MYKTGALSTLFNKVTKKEKPTKTLETYQPQVYVSTVYSSAE